jgi:hypothetical protein
MTWTRCQARAERGRHCLLCQVSAESSVRRRAAAIVMGVVTSTLRTSSPRSPLSSFDRSASFTTSACQAARVASERRVRAARMAVSCKQLVPCAHGVAWLLRPGVFRSDEP